MRYLCLITTMELETVMRWLNYVELKLSCYTASRSITFLGIWFPDLNFTSTLQRNIVRMKTIQARLQECSWGEVSERAKETPSPWTFLNIKPPYFWFKNLVKKPNGANCIYSTGIVHWCTRTEMFNWSE